MTASVVTCEQTGPTPWFSDFVGSPWLYAKSPVYAKFEGTHVRLGSVGFGSATTSIIYPKYVVCVMTRDGRMEVEVTKQTYDLLTVDDHVVIKYRKGRWTGALKGKLAQ